MTNYTSGPWRYELRDLEGEVLGEAEARTLSEGDLCVTLSEGRSEKEKAIILVEARRDGTFQVRVLSPDAALLHEQIVGEPRKPLWSTEVFDSAGTLAIKKDGIDVLHMHTVTPDPEFTKVKAVDEHEHQMVIDAVNAAITNLNEGTS